MKTFIPLIINTDIFGYYWSRSMNDEYGVKSYILGHVPLALTNTSKIIEHIKYVDDLKTDENYVNEVITYAKEIKQLHPDAEIVLVPTNDDYVQLTINNREALEAHVKFHVPSKELMDQIMDKEKFYDLATKHGLSMAYTIFHQVGDSIPDVPADNFPMVVKPNDGILYYKNPFEGQDKIFFCDTPERMHEVINMVEASGYDDKLILQEYIPGNDTYLGDAHLYVNTEGGVQFVSLSQVILQEPEGSAIGNYVTLISRYDRKIMETFKEFLLDIGYTGFANFDFKRDAETGEYKVFEINMRAGRSAYYVEYSGESLAKNLVDDIVYDKRHNDTHYLEDGFVSSFAPSSVIKRFAEDGPAKEDALRTMKAGHLYNPLRNPKDKSLKRWSYLTMRDINYIKKFRDNDWTDTSKN